MIAADDQTWWLEEGPCTAFRHYALAEGPLSLFLSVIHDPVLHDRVVLTWAAVGNRNAWWCYACGAWGVSRFSITRPSALRMQPLEG